MSEPTHHSIGEVLSLLKEEHADVTISKIRFFESQGLIEPERTASGYRKFYDDDIERLRWILVQQRDHYLPLKVIKKRLEDAGFDPALADAAPDGPLPEPTLFSRRDENGAEEPTIDLTDPDAPEIAADAEPEPGSAPAPDESATATAEPEPAEAEPEPAADPGPPMAEVPPAPPIVDGDPMATPAGSVSLSALELAESAGVDLALIDDLERLGLIMSLAGSTPAYDHEALVVCRAAATFIARGVEPRHLRMFKVAGEREAGILEQLLSGRLSKGGETGDTARAQLNELVQLGETIQRSILRRSFGPQLD